jgi:ketosteroid isomerase-like protein
MTDFAAAEAAIRQLHARYIDAVWRKDLDAFADCFAQDCEWRIEGMVVRGRGGAVNFVGQMMLEYPTLFIMLGTPILEVAEGEATGRTYFNARNVKKNGEAFAPIGMYYERFVDEGDRWRFKWRLFQTHYRGPPDMSGEFVNNPQYGAPPGFPPPDALG